MKKIISILLAVMLLASLTVSAFAAEPQVKPEDTNNYFSVYRCVAVSSTQHAHQMSIDGGKTWMTVKTEGHTFGNLIGHGTCKTCGYMKTDAGETGETENAEEYHNYVNVYRCVAISPTQHAHQMSVDGGKTWTTVKISEHSFAALTGLGVCKDCGWSRGDKVEPQEDDDDDKGGDDKLEDAIIHGDIGFYNGHAYIVIHQAMTWEDAKAAAEGMGAHLLTITDKYEQKFTELLNDEEETLWIGGFNETEWKWVTDEAWDYTCWTKDFPTANAEEKCTAVAPASWINLTNDAVESIDGFIVEFDDWDDACALVIGK